MEGPERHIETLYIWTRLRRPAEMKFDISVDVGDTTEEDAAQYEEMNDGGLGISR